MADFPSIGLPVGLRQKTIKPAYRGKSSAGYTMSRAMATTSKEEFEVGYDFLSSSDRDTLQTFFNTNQGIEFNWTHPETGGSTYSVVFAEDELFFTAKPPFYWTITLKLQEV